MTDNPFESASALVGDLQLQYDSLVKALPKLQAAKQTANDDLNTLNKQVVAAEAQLETLTQQIEHKTTAYNTWQREQLANLQQQIDSFLKQKADHEATVADTAAQLAGTVKAVEQAQADLQTANAKLRRERAALADRTTVNTKHAEVLAGRETAVKQREDDVATSTLKLASKATELQQREANLRDNETAVTDSLRRAELDKQAAKKLLDDAKSSVADNDVRERALELRAKFIKNKEEELRKKEIALDDRASVLASH